MARSDGKTAMIVISKSRSAALIGAAMVLSSCAGAANTDSSEMSVKQAQPTEVATVKPGADLQFTSHIDGTLVAGTYTDVEITITPAYAGGQLAATANGTAGLEVLSSSARVTHDMATGALKWRVAVRPVDDSLHYLNIMATVDGLPQDDPSARAFAVRIDPGTKSNKTDDPSKGTIIQSGEDSLVVFDAEETMSPDK